MMHKDFDSWNEEKKRIDAGFQSVFFHERQIWWCKLGTNVGFEQDGKGNKFARPILIVRKFNNQIFWGVPLTTKLKKGKFYAKVISDDNRERVLILSQIRLFDSKRLLDKIGTVSISKYEEIKKAIIALFEP